MVKIFQSTVEAEHGDQHDKCAVAVMKKDQIVRHVSLYFRCFVILNEQWQRSQVQDHERIPVMREYR